ncbi:MAG: TonB-dependent receptor, partial [Bacteroidales bacterium]|nr:TonB-dependent receptor [Bacteroidales bacterium]
MKQTIKCLLCCLCAAMFTCVSAFAQVTTSALGGRVVDAQGEPVVGAAVVATHTPSGTVYGVVTNGEGRYTVNGMRTGGPYTVAISCLGYQSLTYTDVTLQLAETFALNATLEEDSEMLSEAMVIAAPASKFSAEKTGAATNISNAQITSLPTVSRSISDVTRLSPYGGNGMSFAGSDGRTANFTIDGANFNNNFGLSSNLPGGGTPISLDAIEELQVVISPYDVRQTNFIGGGVNAITKSGTNTFKGSAYVYHKNESLRGDSVDGSQINGA